MSLQNVMSFQKWLKKTYGRGWNELYCKVSDATLIEYAVDYEIYCHKNNIEPVWS